MRVTIRGITYPTVRQAAKELGVTPNAIHNALNRGTIDNVGLGPIIKDVEPVTIRGVTYPSIKAAAKELGVHINSIYNARRAGSLDRVGLGRYIAPVKIRGVTYPSVKAAAKKFRITVNGIYDALQRGTIDNVGLGPGGHTSPKNGNAKKLDLGRISFLSMAEASRYIGRESRYVSRMIAKGKREIVISEIMKEWKKRADRVKKKD